MVSFAKRVSSCFVPKVAKLTVTFSSMPLPATAVTVPVPNFWCCTRMPTAILEAVAGVPEAVAGVPEAVGTTGDNPAGADEPKIAA